MQENQQDWTLVHELVESTRPPRLYLPHNLSFQMRGPTYVNGTRRENQTIVSVDSTHTLPANLQSRHLYGAATSYPSFSSAGAVNVRREFGAVGDGVVDDTDALQRALESSRIVFLPKGIFRISRTLAVPPGAALVGISNHLAILAPLPGTFVNETSPLLLLEPGACSLCEPGGLGTVVHGVMTLSWIHTAGVYALDWQAEHPRSVYRLSSSWIKPDLCSLAHALMPCQSEPILHSEPMMQISGSGLFYVVHFEDMSWMTPSYRHVLVTGRPLHDRCFYHLNTEHAISDANTEIRDASNVAIFGMKSEGRYNVLWIHNSSNVLLSGYGGNACPMAAYPAGFARFPPSLFRLVGSRNVTLRGLTSYDMMTTLAHGAPRSQVEGVVQCQTPDMWHSVFEAPLVPGGENVSTEVLDRPVVFRRD